MISISKIKARAILDSRGEWTIEALVTLSDGSTFPASVPQGKSIGSYEAHNVSAARARRAIERIISPRLKGENPCNQKAIDGILISLDGTPQKSRLGANAILAVSIAVARAGAAYLDIPLWKHLRTIGRFRTPHAPPRLYINVINGGLHAGNSIRFQEYLVIPRAKTIVRSIEIGCAVYRALGDYVEKQKGASARNIGDEGGYAPNFTDDLEPFRAIRAAARAAGFSQKIDLGLDAAASNIEASEKSLHAVYRKMIGKYGLWYLEDPFGENEWEAFAALAKDQRVKTRIAGDDLTVTNIKRMMEAKLKNSINAVIIKPNQIGTVTEAIRAVRFAKKAGWLVVASHRSGETNDDFIADFAYGAGADGIKLGAPARGERTAKYNRLLEIERFEKK